MTKRFFPAEPGPAAYVGFLQSFAGPWSALHATWPACPELVSVQSQWDALQEDLSDLGRPADAACTAEVPAELAAVGFAYVLVGSRQGAVQLLRHVSNAWPDAPCRFLAPDGAAESWTCLLAWMSQAELPAAQTDEVLEGADACFQWVTEGFDRALSDLQP